jgi:phytol kinase
MLSVRQVAYIRCRFGAVLHDADRKSFGELYFALSIAALLLLSTGEPLLYVIPVIVLTVADAAAAVIGRAFPILPLSGLAKGKTLSGSAAFFATAFLVVALALAGFTQLPVVLLFPIAMIVALTTCLVEAVSTHGLDNILIPAVAYLLLEVLVVGVS